MYRKPDEDWRPEAALPTLLEALRRLNETPGGEPKPEPESKPAAPAGLDASSLYAALRDGLAQFERHAQNHAQFVERLMRPQPQPQSPAAPAPAAPYQETLYLQGPAQGRTAGRFRALNRRDRRVSVATLSRPFSLNGAPALEAPALTLRPGAFYLAPGEARLVTVEAELPGPGRYQSCLDLSMDDALALKLWIEIDVYP